ncbi:cytochrome P450 [Mycena pura]|uniref:Cytochrome P450 n=1 Tax=Mycena pura TaxID=153505 RepID=A0AAD6V9E9_9AGAR|nr:cytochrome P450 [Mycena pura]
MANLYLFLAGAVLIGGYWLVNFLRRLRLRGPPSPSFVFGHARKIMASRSPADLYDEWAREYGAVFCVRGPFGAERFVLCDPKAIAHVLALDSWKYRHSPIAIKQLSLLTGPTSLLSTLGEAHNRQRKILNPVFAPRAVRAYSACMYDSAYKVFAAWEAQLQSSSEEEIIVDISEWMNNVSFDIIGLAAFSHEFKSLDGEPSAVSAALTALGHSKPSPNVAKILLLSQAYPFLLRLPLPRSVHIHNLSTAMDAVIEGLIRKSSQHGENPSSALGVLLNAKELSADQVRVHGKSILLAGFATTSSSIKWALVELAIHVQKQIRLREELASFTKDPSYDELNNLPYLDAVVRETLRLHPVLSDATRVALEDDIIPLARPIQTARGTLIDKLPVKKGTMVTTSFLYTNLSKTIWGSDAAEFKPERWLNDLQGVPEFAKEFPGYHHALAFLDGPRTCLGKGFALAEMKIVLSLLVRKFFFSQKNGEDTKYEKAFFLGSHPKVVGELGGQLPMRVKRVE